MGMGVYMCASSYKCAHACASVCMCQGIDRFTFSVKLGFYVHSLLSQGLSLGRTGRPVQARLAGQLIPGVFHLCSQY